MKFVQWILIYKTKSFCFEKMVIDGTLMTVFTLGICICEGVDDDLGHGTRLVTFSSMACRHLSRNVYVFT